jgi:hypothetical protein
MLADRGHHVKGAREPKQPSTAGTALLQRSRGEGHGKVTKWVMQHLPAQDGCAVILGAGHAPRLGGCARHRRATDHRPRAWRRRCGRRCSGWASRGRRRRRRHTSSRRRADDGRAGCRSHSQCHCRRVRHLRRRLAAPWEQFTQAREDVLAVMMQPPRRRPERQTESPTLFSSQRADAAALA